MKKFATVVLLGANVSGKSDHLFKLLSLGQLDQEK